MSVGKERGWDSLWRDWRAGACALRDQMTAAVRDDWQTAAAVCVLGGAILLAAFIAPATRVGGIATILVVAGCGAAVAGGLTHFSLRSAPGWVAPALAYAVVAATAVAVFADPWGDSGGLYARDWGTHHAVTKALAIGLRDGHVPTWVNGLSTGDAPLELYPALTYYLAAGLAIIFDAVDRIPLVLAHLAIAVQVLLALGTVRLGLRLVSWPLAVVAGLLVLFDRGNGTSGGASAVLYWGLLHNAVALCFWVFALGFLVDGLRRPRLRSSIGFWILAALGVAAHPVGLVVAAATAAALLAVAAFARDVPPRRALVGVFHVALAVALAAAVWQPLAERLLRYGVHYGSAPVATAVMFRDFAENALPRASLEVAVYLGYLGILIGVFSRRAAPTLIAGLAGVLLVGVSSELYLLLELGPSPALARFSAPRLLSAAKVPLYLSTVYLAWRVLVDTRKRWRGSARFAAGALSALVLAWFVRGAGPFLDDQSRKLDNDASPEMPGEGDMAALTTWARGEAAAMTPDRFGRLMHDDISNAVFHLQAESGLPTVSLGAISDLMLRERIEDGSAASLRRFDVRWVLQHGKSPKRGDPATERQIGSFRIREIADWDGRLARVERGAGEVVVSHLEDERIVVELRDTDRPALVALGIGYYPRWRAYYQDGRSLPVYALPATPRGKLHVVAAWLPPGRTEFRPDGALASDGKGRGLTGLSLLLGIVIITLWSWPSRRRRLLRRAARGRRWLGLWWRRRRRVVVLGAAGVFVLALAIGGWRGVRSPARALQVGHGLAGDARVEARRGNRGWRDCPYDRLSGTYTCHNMLEVQDRFGELVNDAPPSWPFVTPIISAQPRKGAAEFRIHLRARLSGDYWAMTKQGAITVTVEGQPPVPVARQTALHYDGSQLRDITLQGVAKGKAVQIAFVLASAVTGELDYPSPPQAPPPELTGQAAN